MRVEGWCCTEYKDLVEENGDEGYGALPYAQLRGREGVIEGGAPRRPHSQEMSLLCGEV